MFKHIYVFCVTLWAVDPVCPIPNCVWKIRDLSASHPLLLTASTASSPPQLYHPTSNSIYLSGGESLVGVCNGVRNYLYTSQQDPGQGAQSATITCYKGYSVTVGTATVDIRDVQCHTPVQDYIKTTNQKCGSRGSLMSVGFQTTLGDFELFKICYDKTNNMPLYSENIIHGNAINGRYRGFVDHIFRDTGLLVQENHFNYIYIPDVQKKELTSLIGPQRTSLYMNNGKYMNRGHMAPKADFIFYYSQRATYYYANSVPQWLTVNDGTWEEIERAARKLASSIGDVTVYTGTHNVLEVKNSQGRKYLLKLGSRIKIPVPSYMWKLVCDSRANCISYVVLNDPLGEVDDKLCDDMSTAKLWGDQALPPEGGRGACCNPRQLFLNMGLTPPVELKGNILQCKI